MNNGMCLLAINPRLVFSDAWRMHRHYVGDFRTIPTVKPGFSVVVGVRESEERFIDDALLFYADAIHGSIERAAAASGLMVASDFHSHAEFCVHDGETVCHLASWSVAFGRN